MKIKINPYDKKSIEEARKLVETYRYSLEMKKVEIVKRLAEIGLEVASVGFSLADYDGVNDISVTVNLAGDKATVSAAGQAVCFIEFGAGVKYGYGYPDSDRPAEMAGIGEYGKGKGSSEKGWFYGNHEHSYGNPPAMAMLTARDTVIEQITQIAREVFRRD